MPVYKVTRNIVDVEYVIADDEKKANSLLKENYKVLVSDRVSYKAEVEEVTEEEAGAYWVMKNNKINIRRV